MTWLSLDPLVPLGPAGRDSVQDIGLPEPLIGDYRRNGVFAVLGARTFHGARAARACSPARTRPDCGLNGSAPGPP